jgi:4-aminobutyrate aminotransferase-like enzyme/Ser/Thr protein kinase RdoA (MazF antagonist)
MAAAWPTDMLRIRYELPAFTTGEAEAIARDHFGVQARARSLPSERDQNFYLAPAGGAPAVLKIANASDDPAVLEMQNRVLQHLAEHAALVALPRVLTARDGRDLVTVEGRDGEHHWVRLLSYVPGRLWADVRPHEPSLLRSLGHVLGTLDATLQDFEHPAAERALKWDLARAGWIRDYLPYIEWPDRRALVERGLDAFEREVVPRLPDLRRSVIYNDANDYNVIIGEGRPGQRAVAGVIDFGDMVFTQMVCEVAVGAAYAAMGRRDSLSAMAHLVAGYHAVWPLTEAELEVVFHLVRARLCTTVANAAYQRHAEPEVAYLTISEAPAWDVLERLEAVPPALACYTFRQACGLSAHPHAPAVRQWLLERRNAFGPIVAPDPREAKRLVFDLSVGSTALGHWADLEHPARLAGRLADQLKQAGASVGVGRYGEPRPFYTADDFKVVGDDGPEWRTVPLGLDLFVPAGTPVMAPFDGQIVSIGAHTGPWSSTTALLIKHEPQPGVFFYSHFSGLDGQLPQGLAPGAVVTRGARLGHVSANPPPHLRLQLLLDPAAGVPESALPRQRDLWLALCTDPALLLGLPDAEYAATTPDEQTGALRERRRRVLGRNLSLAYRQPLTIVRGRGAYLYDIDGRAYLDTVNNVAHVGHSHPRVVAAAQGQMAVLNTNTRYLHENVVSYAERLLATLPPPLSVCYFMCSGSEANELALRLARAHTGRLDTLVVDAAYHGNTNALIEISPYKHAGPGGPGAPPHVHVLPMPDVYRGPFRRGDPRAGERYAEAAAEVVARLARDGKAPGTFIAESILSCGGQIVLPDGYLPAVYARVRAAGGVCIADEVQVGFGRVGSHFWGFETQGVVPDIVTLGKPIGNGYPLAAVVTTPAIAASFDNGMEYFNTFGGNPVSAAVGLAVLDLIADEGLQLNAERVGNCLLSRLRALQDRHALVGDVRGVGLFIGVELVRDRDTLEPAGDEANAIADRMKARGVLMSTDGPFHNVLKIKPPLVFSEADADFLAETLDEVLREDL